MFYLEAIDDLKDEMRKIRLNNSDFILLNPNTLTCPIVRTKIDSELLIKIYKNSQVIINKRDDRISWPIRFRQGLFNMTSDDELFTENKMNNEDFALYEAKMIWNFDHRFSTYENATAQNINEGNLPQLTNEMHQDDGKTILPEKYVSKENIIAKLNNDYPYKWFLIGRGIAATNNERTFIYSVIPYCGVGNSATFIEFGAELKALDLFLLCCNFNSLVYDFIGSQKMGGSNLNAYILEQLPALPRNKYNFEVIKIALSALELSYTSWDIKAFADDVWKEADDDLKAIITKQWEENKEVTGGHEWSPPEWCAIDEEGCPLPPFKWDENRRAVLKAELDAIYAKLYGLTTEELRYILDPQDVYGSDFPGETFRVLKEKEIRLYGEYRTRRLVLEAWERLNKNETL